MVQLDMACLQSSQYRLSHVDQQLVQPDLPQRHKLDW